MEFRFLKFVVLIVLMLLSRLQSSVGIRFEIDKQECFSHSVSYEADNIYVSFVVIKAESSWPFSDSIAVDLVVKGPNGDELYVSRDKTAEKFEFVAHNKGVYHFCFTNKVPSQEIIDFDIHVRHFSYSEHAKDEHLNPLLEQIDKLENALHEIQFEQHWLEAQTDRQALVNEVMTRRAIHKAMFESAALIGASVLQFFLLQCLFDRKARTTRV